MNVFDACITHQTILRHTTVGENQWTRLQIRQGGGGMLSEGKYRAATIRKGRNSVLSIPIPGYAKVQKEVIDATRYYKEIKNCASLGGG